MTKLLATGDRSSIRKIEADDLEQISGFLYSVSITEPLNDLGRLKTVYAETALWLPDSGAVAIVESTSGRMVGTCQHYPVSATIHGIELGYVIHSPNDRGQGYAATAVRLFSDYLFSTQAAIFRQQLMIEVWNTPSWKVAERCGFLREGVMRSSGLGDGDPADCFVYSRTKKDYTEELVSHNG